MILMRSFYFSLCFRLRTVRRLDELIIWQYILLEQVNLGQYSLFDEIILYAILLQTIGVLDMKWFNELPPEFRHLLSSLLTVLIMGQAVKHGYVTPDQATQLQPQISVSTPIQ